jgi:hypothetical protein
MCFSITEALFKAGAFPTFGGALTALTAHVRSASDVVPVM